MAQIVNFLIRLAERDSLREGYRILVDVTRPQAFWRSLTSGDNFGKRDRRKNPGPRAVRLDIYGPFELTQAFPHTSYSNTRASPELITEDIIIAAFEALS